VDIETCIRTRPVGQSHRSWNYGYWEAVDKVIANKLMTEEKLKLMVDNNADQYGPIRFVFLSA